MFCIFKRCYVQGGILIACYCRSQGRERLSNLPGILVIQVFTGIQYKCALKFGNILCILGWIKMCERKKSMPSDPAQTW